MNVTRKPVLLFAASLLFLSSSFSGERPIGKTDKFPPFIHVDAVTGDLTVFTDRYVPGSWVIWKNKSGLFRYTLIGYSDRQDDGSYALEWRMEKYDEKSGRFVLSAMRLGGQWVDGDRIVYEGFVGYVESKDMGYENYYIDETVIQGRRYETLTVDAYDSVGDKLFLTTICSGEIPYPGPSISMLFYHGGVGEASSEVVDFHVPR